MVIKKETTDFKGEHFVFFWFSEEIKKPFKKCSILYKFLMQNCLWWWFARQTVLKPLPLRRKLNDFVSEFNIDDYSITIYNDTNIENGIINFSRKYEQIW
jgi:hypothetical protein